MDALCDRAVDIVRTTAAYWKQMETAPLLKADGLSEDYRLLAEFNDVILAGHERDSTYGVEFITWERPYDGSSTYPITDSRREILQNACTQIENAVSNLDELVQKSNLKELELGASWLAQDPGMSSY